MKLVHGLLTPALLTLAGISAQGQTATSPFLDCWAKLRIGDSVTMTSDWKETIGTTAVLDHKEIRRTVESVTAGGVLVKIETAGYQRIVSTGQTVPTKPFTVSALLAPPPVKPDLAAIGNELVSAMGRTFKTQRYNFNANNGRLYVSDEVPFCVVKMDQPSADLARSRSYTISAFNRS
jgi:hypothetical protein